MGSYLWFQRILILKESFFAPILLTLLWPSLNVRNSFLKKVNTPNRKKLSSSQISELRASPWSSGLLINLLQTCWNLLGLSYTMSQVIRQWSRVYNLQWRSIKCGANNKRGNQTKMRWDSHTKDTYYQTVWWMRLRHGPSSHSTSKCRWSHT